MIEINALRSLLYARGVLCWIAIALHLDLLERLVDLAQVVRGQLHRGGAEVLLQAMRLGGARDWHDPGLLRQEPRQRDLRRCRMLARRDRSEQFDERQVRLARLRLSEAIARDMIQVRLTDSFRFVVVGAPEYLARRGTPQRPTDLLEHDCITFRSRTTGALYAWELERGRRNWRVPVRGGIVTGDGSLRISLAEAAQGLTYALEPMVAQQLREGRLERVLEAYAPTVPGFFLYYPSRAQRSPALRKFVEAAKRLAVSPSSTR